MSTKRKAETHSRALNRPRIMKASGSRTDSERDSGFSDASSEHMSTMDTTDTESSPKSVGQQGPKSSSSGQQASQLAVVGGSYSSLSPMIIMNNVLLKQPGENPPALKPWSFSPTVEVVQPVVQHPQVVFLQPVISPRTAKEATSRHRRSKKYLPILKSYPKIAPHPGDSSSSSGRGTASSSSSCSSSSSSSSSSSYSFCSSSSSSSGSERCILTPSNRNTCQREKLQKSLSVSANNSGSTTPSLPGTPNCMSPVLQNRLSPPTAESSSSSPSQERPSSVVSQAEFMTSLSFTHTSSSKHQMLSESSVFAQEDTSSTQSNFDDGDVDSKRKRFCNTYNILSQSGLLDITLRTKELLRQNRRTQSDLERLKEQTDLFLQALQSGDSSICMKLQSSLQEEEKEEKEKERTVQSSIKAD